MEGINNLSSQSIYSMNIFLKRMVFDYCHPSQDWETSCIQGCNQEVKPLYGGKENEN